MEKEKYIDKVLSKVSWEPKKRGGNRFVTHNLIDNSPIKISLIPNNKSSMQIMLHLAGAVFAPIIASFFIDRTIVIVFIAISAIIFNGIHIWKRLDNLEKIIFDKSLGYFYKGNKSILNNFSNENIKFSRINNISALQIVAEEVLIDESSYPGARMKTYSYVGNDMYKDKYFSYELNLVLKNSKRINILDYQDLSKLKKEAKKLSEFLNVPVWEYGDR